MERGLIHLYFGDGKGKTTAAMGLCMRAAGHGMRVGIAQFLKPGNSGELAILKTLSCVHIFPFLKSVKFTFAMTEPEKIMAKDFYSQLLHDVKAKAPELDILLLDESVSVYTENLIDKRMFIEFLDNRPTGLEIILTGHIPPPELIEMADYISEIKKIRHPFEKGEKARKGIEW